MTMEFCPPLGQHVYKPTKGQELTEGGKNGNFLIKMNEDVSLS